MTDTIGDDFKNWKKGDTVLIQAQTGTGKTYFIKNKLLDNMASHERLLFVCNRTNLKRQLKKDLLKKYKQPIPETLNELDDITTIADKITITSYHAISHTIKNNIYDENAPKVDLSIYDYIILDEAHFILTDGSFNNKTRFAYDKLIKEWQPHSIKIFISATMQEIEEPIIRNVERNKKNGFGLDSYDIHKYSTGNDYSYVKPNYFIKINTIATLIKNDKSDDKWLIFVSNIKRDANKLINAIGRDKCSLIKAGTESDELNSIINNGKFYKKVLIATKALDNGINIKDDKLKNIVIMAWDQITFIQMLGRKRIDIESPEEVDLYIPVRYKKSFLSKLLSIRNKQKEIELLEHDKNAFHMKYDNDLKDYYSMNDIFYYDNIAKEIKVNNIGRKRLMNDIKFAEYMSDKFDAIGKYAFIKEQLSWLELEGTFNINNLIDDVIDQDENDKIIEYLDNIIGKKLFKEEQNDLKNIFYQNGLKARTLGINTLNGNLKDRHLPYMILSKRTSERTYKKIKSFRYWEITKDVIVS